MPCMAHKACHACRRCTADFRWGPCLACRWPDRARSRGRSTQMPSWHCSKHRPSRFSRRPWKLPGTIRQVVRTKMRRAKGKVLKARAKVRLGRPRRPRKVPAPCRKLLLRTRNSWGISNPRVRRTATGSSCAARFRSATSGMFGWTASCCPKELMLTAAQSSSSTLRSAQRDTHKPRTWFWRDEGARSPASETSCEADKQTSVLAKAWLSKRFPVLLKPAARAEADLLPGQV
mmetsp:Transcript_11649/g.27874  ORF Transcript_11649/g.27874 Transcript_11649/m.27874 type:complete len:232 (-) Transcript_11649:86-781(-)